MMSDMPILHHANKDQSTRSKNARRYELLDDDGKDVESLQDRGVLARLDRSVTRWQEYLQAHSMRYLISIFGVILAGAMLFMPSPYVVESPGPTRNVLGESGGSQIISISGATTYADTGQLLMLTVNASGLPGYPVPNVYALWGWASPHMEVLPQEAIFPKGQTAEEYQEETDAEMSESQSAAQTAALAYAKKLGVDVSNVKVSMHIDDIGGPSAGMMYTLGVIDKLTEQDESGGKTIAGTGTIDKDGNVGAIGGIRLKMIGAKRDGATWFLAPASNCDEVVGHVPEGLTDVKVSNIDEAYQALVAIGSGNTQGLEHCTA